MEIPRQNIDIARLQMLGIYELRNLARELGVSRPTTHKRETLIELVVHQLRSGGQPAPRSVRGRPPRSKVFNVAEILEPEPLYETILERPDTTSMRAISVCSPLPVTEPTRTGSGFLHTLPRGHGVLISFCLNTYYVPIRLITTHSLETGDHAEVKAVWSESDKRYIVEQITRVTKIGFDSAESARPHKSTEMGRLKFKLGQRIMVCTPRNYDRIESIARYNKMLEPKHKKIVLLVEESDDCVDYLRENGIHEVYLVKVNFSVKKQLMLALTALFNAKRYAAMGNDVVLAIDNLNKLFKLYNASAIESGTIETTQINLGSLTDIKTFFMSAKQIKDGGSLTIIGHANKPSSEMEKFVMDEFSTLANVYLEI